MILCMLCYSVVFAEDATREKLVFSPQWLPQAQFAGYYVAQDQGFYSEAGLDVDIIHPSGLDNSLDFLKKGAADIVSHFLVAALSARNDDNDIVNIAQLSQQSAILFVSRKESNIQSLSDFNEKTIGIWKSGFDEMPRATVIEHGLDVTWVPILGTVDIFLVKAVDIMTVMWYNEYYQIYLSGVDQDELNRFFLSDYGYDIPEDGLYVMKETLDAREDDLRAFVEATLRGWDYAEKNKDYTLELVLEIMRKYHIPANLAHQSWMLDRVLELMQFDNKPIKRTELYIEDYKTVTSILKKHGFLPSICDYEDFFHPILKEIR